MAESPEEKDLLGKIMTKRTYQTGKLGLQELLKEGLLEKLGKMSRIEEESKAVERLLEEMGKGGKAVLKENIGDSIESGLEKCPPGWPGLGVGGVPACRALIRAICSLHQSCCRSVRTQRANHVQASRSLG